jgi:hypothetical protein
VERNQLIVRSTSGPRQGWDQQFRAMKDHGDDRLLEDPVLTRWDASEWKW